MLVESIALFGLALSTLSSSRAPKARKTRERLFGVPVPRGAVLGSKGDSELYLCIHGLDPEEFDPEQWMVIGHIRKDGAICYPYTTLYDSDSPIDEIVGETIPRGEPFSDVSLLIFMIFFDKPCSLICFGIKCFFAI